MKLNRKYYLIRVKHITLIGYVKLLFSFKNDEPIVNYEDFESQINDITKFRVKIFAEWICKMLNRLNYIAQYDVVCFIKRKDVITKKVYYERFDNKIKFTELIIKNTLDGTTKETPNN